MLELVDDVGVLAMGAHDGIADYGVMEFIGEGVPGAEVFPLTGEGNNGYGFCFFSYFVIEGDFRELLIACSCVFKRFALDVLLDGGHHVI